MALNKVELEEASRKKYLDAIPVNGNTNSLISNEGATTKGALATELTVSPYTAKVRTWLGNYLIVRWYKDSKLFTTFKTKDGTKQEAAEFLNVMRRNYEADFVSESVNVFAFTFPESTGPATIDYTAHTIAVTVAAATNVTALVATYDLSSGATAMVGVAVQQNGVTANDFTLPVVYAINAEDAIATQNWTVTVTVAS